MNQTEHIRRSLLTYLDANAGARWGLTEAALQRMLLGDGFRCEQQEVRAELTYLRDKGFIGTEAKQISPENRQWRITASGRDHHAELTGT